MVSIYIFQNSKERLKSVHTSVAFDANRDTDCIGDNDVVADVVVVVDDDDDDDDDDEATGGVRNSANTAMNSVHASPITLSSDIWIRNTTYERKQ
jgi:hypothetical protein